MKKRNVLILAVMAVLALTGCQTATDPADETSGGDKAITAFSFTSPAATGKITESTYKIAITVPYGTNVTALSPTITITGENVSPASGAAQNFTNPVTYTVTAKDGTTQAYTVTVIVSTLDIGVVLPTESYTVYKLMGEKFLAGFGTQATAVVMYSQGDLATEKANVDTLIAKGIKVLVLDPVTSGAEAATAAKAAGIKVVNFDRLITNTENVDYYLTFDSINVGKKMGQYLVDQLPATGSYLYLYAGHPEDNNSLLFFQGSWTILQPKIADGTFVIKNSAKAVEYKNTLALTNTQALEIIAEINTEWKWTTAQTLAKNNIVAAAPPASGKVYVLAPNDVTARAISEIFRSPTSEGGGDVAMTDLCITGQDAEKDSVQNIIDGKQSMTIFKDIRLIVSSTVTAALTFFNGSTPETDKSYDNGAKTVPAKEIATELVTNKTEIQSVLIDLGYYKASDFTGL